jgi:hypothetical protein
MPPHARARTRTRPRTAQAAKLTHLERALHPVRYSISPVVEKTTQTPVSREVPTVGGHPLYVLQLEYSFKVAVPSM